VGLQAGFIPAVSKACNLEAPPSVAEERWGFRGGGRLSSPALLDCLAMADAAAALQQAAADIPLTRDARDVLDRAAVIASERGSQLADPVDVLQATLESRGTRAEQSIRALGGDVAAMIAKLPPPANRPGIPLRQLLINASREAQVLGHYQVDSIHLLLAMLYHDSPITSAVLQQAGLTLYDLRKHLQTGAAPMTPSQVSGATRPDAALRRKPLPSLRGVLSVSPVFLLLVAVTAGAGAALWFNVLPAAVGVTTIVFVTAGWITSVCIHEFGHAFVAYLGGDRSVIASGYLTLNPLRYTNLLVSIVMPIIFLLLGGIGLPGGAVYIDHAAIRSRVWDSAVSLAGPVGTLLCGLLVVAPFMVPGHDAWINAGNVNFFAALAYLGLIEAIGVVLNLLPIPGLDGFGILRPWLPYAVQVTALRFSQTAFIGVFILLWYVPPVRDAFFGSIYQLTTLIGIDPGLLFYGQSNMRFH
jgi:Zn-dependent protease